MHVTQHSPADRSVHADPYRAAAVRARPSGADTTLRITVGFAAITCSNRAAAPCGWRWFCSHARTVGAETLRRLANAGYEHFINWRSS